jgi:Holliday junction DNA helicase RuvB
MEIIRSTSIPNQRLSVSHETTDDQALHETSPSIRPTRFDDYPGQDEIKKNLQVYVGAALKRDRPLDHVILHGAPGLGKTTLANIIANELDVPFVATSGPAIDKAGDLAGILTGLEPGSLLFVDEIHRLSIKIEEVLYSAMEDFTIDIIIGQGASARSVRMDVAQFTLVGATTRLSLLSRPLLGRFGIQERLEFYGADALKKILFRTAGLLGFQLTEEAALEIANRSRGTPRLANRLLRRVADFADVEGLAAIDRRVADVALTRQGIDTAGLDRIDRRILEIMRDQYDGGPVGIETLAVTLNEDRATLEDVYEPYLVFRGLIARTPRGRVLTSSAKHYLNEL